MILFSWEVICGESKPGESDPEYLYFKHKRWARIGALCSGIRVPVTVPAAEDKLIYVL